MKQKNKNPSARVISPNNFHRLSSRCFFCFLHGTFCFNSTHQGPPDPPRLSSIHKICKFFPTATWNHRKTKCSHLISSDEIHWYLNWTTNHGDENHPALTQYFSCIGFHVIRSSFLTPWHFCLKIALPRASTHPSNCCYGSIIFVSSKMSLSIWTGKNPSFRISICWIYILIYANLQVLTGSHHISSSLHSSAFDVLREFGVSHGHEVASWKKNWILRLGEGLSCCCHVENCGSK